METDINFYSSDKKDYFPLSFEQERMWFLEQLEPGNPAYNIRGAIQIKGRLNADILEQSINEIIRRHEILRTTFNIIDGQPRQIIGSPFRVEVPVVNLQKLSATEREQEAMRLATQVVQQPFNLSKSPLWRVSLLLLDQAQHILVLSMHHIVCDGDLSIGIFFREIAVLFEAFSSNQPSPLSQLPIQYKEFTLWQREHLKEELLEAQLAYWKQQLGDNLPILQLPTDRPRPPIQTYPGACQKLKLSKNLTSQLKLLKEQQGVTLFALLLAAFKTLLYRYTRQEDIIVGSPVSGRHLSKTEELIGYFGNPLVLRTDVSGNPTFLQLLSRVAFVVTQAKNHQDYPFQKLVEELKPERDMSIPPLFQVLFILRDDLMPTLELPSFTLTTLDVEGTSVPYDLCISIKNTDSGLVWTWEYNTDLFESATITRILKHFRNLLESIVENPEGRIGELSILTEAERHQLLVKWNNTKTEYPQVCIHKLVEAQIEKTPDAVAVVWENQQLTYGELNCRANQLAHYLQKLGVKPEGLVGICTERSPQMMIAILAVLKAGGAYVPLDPAYPKERLEYMLSDANVQVLLTTETLLLASSQIAEIAKNQEVVYLDSEWEIISTESKSNPVSEVQPHNLAYIIYTSGSTGKPKGVMMEHLALSNLIDWHLPHRTKGARTLQFASFSFDISFHEIFSTWCSVGTLVLISEDVRRNPEALLNAIALQRIEKLYLPFVALQQLVEVIDDGTVPTTVREVMTAGEQLQITPAIANFFRQTGCTLHNHYGATECQDVTSFTLTGDANSWPTLPPIGRPINNIQTYILDEFYQPVPIGVPGELYIGGDGIARGYFNRLDLTQEKFIPNPFCTGSLYKTGDLARIWRDGNIEHLGRADRQVKIRGFRIELGEIEGLLAKHPTVRESAVIATEDVPGNKRLIAYVVPVQEQITSQLELTLRSYLKENLPDYMVPAVIVMLDEMPLTPSGKVDRRALPTPDKFRPELSGALVMPQSDTEKLIAGAWQDVLQLEEVGIHDNFFELGGNSLLLIQVHKKLIASFGAGLPTVALFQYPTIYALAQHLSQTQIEKPTLKRHKSRGRRTYHREDIAIIGMSCRFPGAENIDAFWQNLRSGVESISWFSDGEIELDDQSLLSQPNYVKAGAVLPNIDLFDAEFFGYSAREASIMDPQQRIFFECAWEALESAGYNPKIYEGLVGVYAGSGMSTYLINNVCPYQGFSPRRPFLESNSLQVRLGNERNYFPTRISYKLGLTGPSVNIQTACSTSLVAVHMAIQSLQSGECDMALAGGVSLVVPQKVGYLYEEGMIHSPDGHCRAFDSEAQGTIFGNGAGIVVLKRLDEASDKGDNIIAVIKGSAINNDGDLKVGYTAPSVEGQAAAIARALAVADIDASTVSYVETHGTATPLGDPLEIAALTKAFQESTDTQKNGFCAIGSVKTNVGHLDEAAGIAGLIKTVLALKHKSIPPSLHFKQPNPNIDFANSPFYVNTALTEWKTNGMPRRAGVSSFGMGGTNCHVVLEEAPSQVKSQNLSEFPTHILTLSAKTEKALEELAQRYVNYLGSDLNTELADICFTANTGREHFNYRWAVIGKNKQQFQQQLVSLIESKPKPQLLKTTSKKRIAFLFTGQGSQYAGMGRQLYETQPTFRQIINRCDEILRPYLEQPLLSVLYPDNPSQNSKVDETAYTQPALFALEYALAQLWKSWGIEPDVVMGHSVGEYVAACFAGVFSLEDGLKLIATRGKLMQALPQDGEMVALLASESQVQEAIAPYSAHVSIAAINAPNSVVISGQRKAINAICATLEASGIKTKKLNVSHAFHSPLMSPMLGEFERVARQVNFSPPKIKRISNVTGKEATLEITTPEYWCRHIRQPVRFARCIESLEEQEIDVFVEIGAKPILLGMARQCLPEHLGLWLPSLRPDQEDWQELLSSLAQLYVHGVPIDWVGFNLDYTRRRLPLPTYPFQRQRYWVEAPKDNGTQALALANKPKSSRQHPLLGQKLCLPGTKQIRFQGQISKNFPNWLQDHRVFESTIVPGTAYLDMALAAGVAVAKSKNLTLENVLIRKALILPEDGEQKIIQLVLTPQETLFYTFEIFSLESPRSEDKGQPNWILHASGKLLVKDKDSPIEALDLGTLQSQCQQEVSIELLYERYQQQNINYGSSFRAIQQVWRHETAVLGKIRLPEQVTAQEEDYQLHPVLLEACLQILEATFLEDNYQNTYVPVGVERLLFYTLKSADIWCYAQLRQVEEKRHSTLSADLHLLTPNGIAIAILEGLQLKRAPREAMLGTAQKSWQDWLYEVEWRPQERYGLSPEQTPTRSRENLKPRNWLILADTQGTGQQLGELVRSIGESFILVLRAKEYEQIASGEFTIDPANPSHFQQLLQAIPNVATVVHLWSLDVPKVLSGTDLEETSLTSCGSTLYLVQALVKHYAQPPCLWLVTRGAQTVNGHPVHMVAQSPLWGMGKVIALEHPELNCVRVDLDPEATVNEAQTLFEEIISSLSTAETEDQVAFRDQNRYVARLVRRRPEIVLQERLTLSSNGTYLITGGLGGLGLLVAHWLVERGAKHLVLLSRSGQKLTGSNQLEKLEKLEQAGACVRVIQADVSDTEQLARILSEIEQSLPPLRGILHAAGVLDDGVLQQLHWQRFAPVMAPKVQGAWNLHRLTQNKPIDFFVLFSSSTSLLGAGGQANYAAANAFLDALASYRRMLLLPGLSINWGAWAEVGMTARLQLGERFSQQGEGSIAPQQGLQVLEQLLTIEPPVQVGVMPINWSRFLQKQLTVSPFLSDFLKEFEPLAEVEFREQLEALLPRERKALLVAHVRTQVAKVLGMSLPESIELGQQLIDLGLDSLMAIELRSHLQSSLRCSLPSTVLFDYPTLEALVNYLAQEVLSVAVEASSTQALRKDDIAGNDSYRSTLVPIQPHGSKPPLFFIPGILGSVFDLYPLARYLGSEQPFYGLRSLGLDENEKPYTRMADIAAHHIKALQAVQPSGPYLLGGHSFGGRVAFEMAQQLQNQRHEVSMLVLVDSWGISLDKYKDLSLWNNIEVITKLSDLYGSILGKNLEVDFEALQFLSADEQLNYLLKKLNAAGLKLTLTEISRIFQVYKANTQADTEYVPQQSYPSAIIFFRASEIGVFDFLPDEATTLRDPTWGWRELSAKPVELHIVPGNHFTMMNEPFVRDLAKQVILLRAKNFGRAGG
jgi:malonyl CoA-acyl carrier protein transacylase